MHHILRLDWYDFNKACNGLASKLKGKRFPIVAQPRGGLPIGVRLSHLLDLKMGYNPVSDQPVIWVDDIIDTGKTLERAEKLLHEDSIFVSWVVKPRYEQAVMHEYVHETDQWVVFPWECVTPSASGDL